MTDEFDFDETDDEEFELPEPAAEHVLRFEIEEALHKALKWKRKDFLELDFEFEEKKPEVVLEISKVLDKGLSKIKKEFFDGIIELFEGLLYDSLEKEKIISMIKQYQKDGQLRNIPIEDQERNDRLYGGGYRTNPDELDHDERF